MSILSEPFFHDETAAIEKLEQVLWPNGPVCPHCSRNQKIYALKGKATRPGLWKCGHCRKQFTVKVGTIFESSHVPTYKWLQAVYLMCASKKGISSNQLHRTLEVTLKTAWFMSHRIREAMRDGGNGLLGGLGKIVEVDEAFIGHDYFVKPRGEKKGRGFAHKHKVLSLVERGGRIVSMVVDNLKAKTLIPILKSQIDSPTRIMTDEARQYSRLDLNFLAHDFVRHNQGEYGRGQIYTNTVEGFFSIFKRGMKGVCQHCAKRYLHRYVTEFDFRYNERGVNDEERAEAALFGAIGKRLTYSGSPIAA